MRKTHRPLDPEKDSVVKDRRKRSGTGLSRAGGSRRANFKISLAASSPRKFLAPPGVVELIGIEPTTSGLQSPRSPS
jgi:hypothetical protein